MSCFTNVFVLLWIYSFGSCTHGQGVGSALATACDENEFRHCFVDLFHTTIDAVRLGNTSQICSTGEFSSAQSCSLNYIENCSTYYGTVIPSVVGPYVRLLNNVFKVICEQDFPSSTCSVPFDHCLLDFAQVVSNGQLGDICRQADVTLECLKPALDDCTDLPRYLVAMVADEIQLTSDLVCNHDTCNLEVAQQCLHEGMMSLEHTTVIVSQSPVICRQVRRSVACVTNRTLDCNPADIPPSMAKAYWFLYQFVDQQCREPVQDLMLTDIPAYLVSSVYLASLATSPWSSVDDICSLFNATLLSAVTQGNIMSTYTPYMLTWQRTMELNLALYGDVCLAHLDLCAIGTDHQLVCDVMESEQCVEKVLLSKMVVEAGIGKQTWNNACFAADSMLRCVESYTAGCQGLEDLTRLTELVNFVVMLTGDKCQVVGTSDRPTICDNTAPCDVMSAWVTCGAVTAQSADVCLNSTEIYMCYQHHISRCNSIQAYPPQFYLEYLLRDCPRNESLLPNDDLLGISRCKMQFGYNVYGNIFSVSTFASAICPAIDAHQVCLTETPMPQMARFYLEKHNDYFSLVSYGMCSNWTRNSDAVSIQEQDGCHFDDAMVEIISYIQPVSNFPLMSVLEKEEFCSFPDDLAEIIIPMVSDCTTTRQSITQEALYFYDDMFRSYCAVTRPGLQRSCDVSKIRTCLEDFGATLNMVSAALDVCGPLQDTFTCLYDNSRGCDGSVKQTLIQEVVAIHSMLGNITCPRMPWCDSAANETWIQEVCKEEPAFDIDWLSCIAVENFAFCLNLTDTIQCIERKLAGYDPVLYVTLKSHMTQYGAMINSPCNYIHSDPPSVSPVHYAIHDCDQYLATTSDVTKLGLCTAIGYYLQCVSAIDQSELPYVWRGILGRNVQTWTQKKLYLGCQLAEGEEFVVDARLHADNITSPQCEFDLDTYQGRLCLRTLAEITLTYVKMPVSERLENYCYVTDELVSCVHREVGGCSDDQQRAMLSNAQWFREHRDFIGICSSDIQGTRPCNPSKAIGCIADLGVTLNRQLDGGVYKAACSKLLPVAACVDAQTSSCDFNVRRDVMYTFTQVSTIVGGTCSEAPPTSPSTCSLPGEATLCDLEEALVCMVPVQTRLLQTMSGPADVCGAIPAMKSCIRRHTSGCDVQTLATVDRLLTALVTRLYDQCPEIYCDECGVRACLGQFQQALQYQANTSLCLLMAEARQCIYSSARYCDAGVGESLLQEMELLVGVAGERCAVALPTCLQTFMYSAYEVLTYDNRAVTNSSIGGSDLVYLRLCSEAEAAYECVSYHVAAMEGHRRLVMNETLQHIGSLVYRQCQGRMLQCYSCVNATSNEECNTHPTHTCDPHTQVCGTYLASDTINKGCVSQDICQAGCLGNHCTFCCHGDLCNQPWNYAVVEAPTCQPQGALWCGFQLMSSLAQNSTVDCSSLQDAISCIQEYTSDCVYEHSSTLGSLAQNLLTSDAVAECVAQSSVCACGQCTSLILLTLISSPYEDRDVFCSHLGQMYNETVAEMNTSQCGPADLMATYSNLNMASYLAQGICMMDAGPNDCYYSGKVYKNGESLESQDGCNVCYCSYGSVACSLMYCPPEFQCPTVPGDAIGPCVEACHGNYNCTNDTLCCYNGCGHTCQPPVNPGGGDAQCLYGNATYRTGESFVAMDGCNYCLCSNGNVACTEMYCPPSEGGNETRPRDSGCDIVGVEQCINGAALPYLSSVAYTGGMGHICLSAKRLLQCVHPKIRSCPESLLLHVRSALWWNLGHVDRFCDIADIIQHYNSENNVTSPNTTLAGKCSLVSASLCYDTSIGMDICGSYQEIVDCVTNFTAGCLSLDRVPVQFELQRHLRPVLGLCNFTIPHSNSDQLTDIANCTMKFAQNVSGSLSQHHQNVGQPLALCDDLISYMSCLHLLDVSPLGTMYVGNMVQSLSGIMQHCLLRPSGESIQCHRCNGSTSMEDCDRRPLQTCGPQQVCHMTLQLDGSTGVSMVTKGCADTQWCQTWQGCNPDYMTCVHCCYGDQCNTVNMTTSPTAMPTTPDPWQWTTPTHNNRTQQPTTTFPETCHLEPIASFMTVHMLRLVNFNFIPLVERTAICSNYEATIQSMLEVLHLACPGDLTAHLSGVAGWLTDWTAAVCPQPHNSTVSMEKCLEAVSCVQHLGNLTTQNQTCRSLQKASSCLETYYTECPRSVQVALNRTGELLHHMEQAVCVGEKPAGPPPPCVDVMMRNMTSPCDSHKAMKCAMSLKKSLYNPFTTRDEFCIMMKRGMQCIDDNTNNCSQDVYEYVTPVVMEILQRAGGACPDTWCPVSDHCRLDVATGCLTRLEYMLGQMVYSGHMDRDICINITSTYHCIMNATEDCLPQDQYVIQQRFQQTARHLYSFCHQAPVNISACHTTFGNSITSLLHFDDAFTSQLVMSIAQYAALRMAQREVVQLSDLIVRTVLQNAGYTNMSHGVGFQGVPSVSGIALPGVLSSRMDGIGLPGVLTYMDGLGLPGVLTYADGLGLPGVLTFMVGDGIALPGVLSSYLSNEELNAIVEIINSTDVSELFAAIAKLFGLPDDLYSRPDSGQNETSGHTGRRKRQAETERNATHNGNGTDTGSGFWNDNSTVTNGNNTSRNQSSPSGGDHGSRPDTNITDANRWNNTGSYIMSLFMQSLHQDKLLSLLNLTKPDLIPFVDQSVINIYLQKKASVCNHNREAYQCLYNKLSKQMLPSQQEYILQQTLESLKAVAMEMCDAPRCYSCHGLRDDVECNRQPVQTCDPLETCQSVVHRGLVTKGCTNTWTCEEECRHSNGPCHCCHGDLCNRAIEPVKCDIVSAVTCADQLLLHSIHNHNLNRSFIYHKASCMQNFTRNCHAKSHRGIHNAGYRILKLLEAETCSGVNRLSNCTAGNCTGRNVTSPCTTGNCSVIVGTSSCNKAGLVALTSAMLNPYRTPSSICQLFNASLEVLLSTYSVGRCQGDDLDAARWSMVLIHSQIKSVCRGDIARLYHNETMNCMNMTSDRNVSQINGTKSDSVSMGTGNTSQNGTRNQGDRPVNSTSPSGNGTRSEGNGGNGTAGPSDNCSQSVVWTTNQQSVCEITVAMEMCVKPYINMRDITPRCIASDWTKLTSCVHNFTSGCLSVQLITIQNTLSHLWIDCAWDVMTVNTTARPSIFPDPFMPTAECLRKLVALPTLFATDASVPYSLCHMISQVTGCLATNTTTLPMVSRMYLPGIVGRLEDLQHLMCGEGPGSYNYTGNCSDSAGVKCVANPCDAPNIGSTHCPNLPTAQCVLDDCRTCEPEFFFRGMKITDTCFGDNNITDCDVVGVSRKVSFYTTMLITRDWLPLADMDNLCSELSVLESLLTEISTCSSRYRPAMERLSRGVYSRLEAVCSNSSTSHTYSHGRCDVGIVMDMYKGLAEILTAYTATDDVVCLKLRNAIGATEDILSPCAAQPNLAYLRDSFLYMRSVVQDRCPNLTSRLYCNPRLSGLKLNDTVPPHPSNLSTTIIPTSVPSTSTIHSRLNFSTPADPPKNTPSSIRSNSTTIPTTPTPRLYSTTSINSNVTSRPMKSNMTRNSSTQSPTRFPTKPFTTRPGPTDRPTNGSCYANQAQWCIFDVTVPNRTLYDYCSKFAGTVRQLRLCVIPKITGCTEMEKLSLRNYYRTILHDSQAHCGRNFTSQLFGDELSGGCRLPKCSFLEAHNCLGHLQYGHNNTCGNLGDVKACVTMAMAGCNDLQRYHVLAVLRKYAELLQLPRQCWRSLEVVNRSSHMIGVIQCLESFTTTMTHSVSHNYNAPAEMCSIFTSLLACMDHNLRLTQIPPVVVASFSHTLVAIRDSLHLVCNTLDVTNVSPTPVGGQYNDSTSCDVKTAVFCLNSYAVNVMLGPAMTADGKQWLCTSLSQKAECIESAISECSRHRVQQFRLAYQLLKMLGQLSGVCSPAPAVCDAQIAVQCVSTLGRAVTSHGVYSHTADVCRAIEYTKSCIRQTTLLCSADTRQSIMDTLEPISCQAYSICPMAIEDADVVVEMPPSCVDPNSMGNYGTCEPQGALYCLQEFYMHMNDPFGSHNRMCRSYADALQCFFRHVHHCDNDVPVLLAHLYLQRIVGTVRHHCPIRISTPCDPDQSHDCDLGRIEDCLSQMRGIVGNGTQRESCFALQDAKQCIHRRSQSCPNVTRVYAQSLYLHLTAAAPFVDVDCSGVDQCAWNYVRYMKTLLHNGIYMSSRNQTRGLTQEQGRQLCEMRTSELDCVKSQVERVPADVGLIFYRSLGHLEVLFTDTCAYVYGLQQTTCSQCDSACLTCYSRRVDLHSILPPLLSFMEEANTTIPQHNDTHRFCHAYDVFHQQMDSTNGSISCSGEDPDWLTMYQHDLDQLHRKYCPEMCNVTTARGCMGRFLAAIVNASKEDICQQYEDVRTCVNSSLLHCNHNFLDRYMAAVHDSLNNTNVRCYKMPDLQVATQTDAIALVEGGSAVYINVTMANSPSDSCYGDGCYIEVSIVIEDGEALSRCSNGKPIAQVLTDSCSITFTVDNWHSTLSIPVWARIDHKVTTSHNATVTLFAKLYEDGVVVAVRDIASLRVSVVDKDTTAMCSSVSDPHLTSFDGLAYDTHQQREFVLYQHKDEPYQVNVAYQRCRPGSVATCTCAAMVRSGDDVFVLDRCRRQGERSHPLEFRVHQNGDLTVGTLVYTTQDGNTFQFVLPTGTIVTVQTSDAMLDVWVKPSPRDLNNTLGLCGTYDGIVDNDLTRPDMAVENIGDVPDWGNFGHGRRVLLPNIFVNSWRAQESLFVGIPASDYAPTTDHSNMCTCPAGPVCKPTDVVETCDLVYGDDITSKLDVYRQTVPDARPRRKRQTSNNPIDDIDWDDGLEPELPVWPTPSGWTAQSAIELCENSIVNSTLGQLCAPVVDVDVFVTSCMTDILLFDSTDHIAGVVEDMRMRCRTAVLSDPGIAVTLNTTYEELVPYMLNLTCSRDCMGHGTCANGTCLCETGYFSNDCSVLQSDTPTITSLSENVFSSTGETVVYTETDVFGGYFVNNDQLTCHYQPLEFNLTTLTFKETGDAMTSSAIFLTYESVRCSLTGSLPLTAYYISVSNNGVNQSAELGYIILDPVCYSCNPATMKCGLQPTSCVLEGQCYIAGAYLPDDTCFICDPISNTFKYKTSETCLPPTTLQPTTTSTPDASTKKPTDASTGSSTISINTTTTDTTTEASTKESATTSAATTPSSTLKSTQSATSSTATESTVPTDSSTSRQATTTSTPSSGPTTDPSSTTGDPASTTGDPASTTGVEGGTRPQDGDGDDDGNVTAIVIGVGAAVSVVVLVGVVIVAMKLRHNDSKQLLQGTNNAGPIPLARGQGIQGRPHPAYIDVPYDNVLAKEDDRVIPRRDAPTVCAPFNPEGLSGEPVFSRGAVGIRGDDDGMYQVNMEMFAPPRPSEPAVDYATVSHDYNRRQRDPGLAENYDNVAFDHREPSDPAEQEDFNMRL